MKVQLVVSTMVSGLVEIDTENSKLEVLTSNMQHFVVAQVKHAAPGQPTEEEKRVVGDTELHQIALLAVSVREQDKLHAQVAKHTRVMRPPTPEEIKKGGVN